MRDITFRKFYIESEIPKTGPTPTEYGKGFRDGADLAEKRVNLQLVWSFIARHGDFAIEILWLFGDDDWGSMMDETLFDNNVVTGTMGSQEDEHKRAWDIGYDLGLWFLDAEKERLVLTKRGRFFRDVVRKNEDLQNRYNNLVSFWNNHHFSEQNQEKPGASPFNRTYQPGWVGWLQCEKYKPVKIRGRHELFVLTSVESDKFELQCVDTQKKLVFPPQNLLEIEYEEESGLLTMILKNDPIET